MHGNDGEPLGVPSKGHGLVVLLRLPEHLVYCLRLLGCRLHAQLQLGAVKFGGDRREAVLLRTALATFDSTLHGRSVKNVKADGARGGVQEHSMQ